MKSKKLKPTDAEIAAGLIKNLSGHSGTLNARLHVKEWKRMAVVDATKDIQINVTVDDIKNGEPKSLGYCAFALACREQLDSRQVQFMHHRAYLDLPVAFDEANQRVIRRVERFTLPPATRRFVEAFDKGEKVEAGSYTLRAPRPSETLAAINARRKTTKKSGKPHPRKPVVVHASGFVRSGTGVMRSHK